MNSLWLQRWRRAGEKTVVVGVNSEAQLLELEKQALSLSLPMYLVRDAGRTEIDAGSSTVLGIGGPADVVDQVTGKLRLLHSLERIDS